SRLYSHEAKGITLRISGAVCHESGTHGSNREVRGIIPTIDSNLILSIKNSRRMKPLVSAKITFLCQWS
ncbi:MAG: hypothetical protein KME38_24495, partial [Spirirestis rafaelensis WJT71-NPBG6]|nr:hypothetical protein [Spirirestis rafaelensis WJT71-NPBG6]